MAPLGRFCRRKTPRIFERLALVLPFVAVLGSSPARGGSFVSPMGERPQFACVTQGGAPNWGFQAPPELGAAPGDTDDESLSAYGLVLGDSSLVLVSLGRSLRMSGTRTASGAVSLLSGEVEGIGPLSLHGRVALPRSLDRDPSTIHAEDTGISVEHHNQLTFLAEAGPLPGSGAPFVDLGMKARAVNERLGLSLAPAAGVVWSLAGPFKLEVAVGAEGGTADVAASGPAEPSIRPSFSVRLKAVRF